MRAAVQRYRLALKHVAAELKADREVLLAAVQSRNGRALKYCMLCLAGSVLNTTLFMNSA
jgi:hypothetical protein